MEPAVEALTQSGVEVVDVVGRDVPEVRPSGWCRKVLDRWSAPQPADSLVGTRSFRGHDVAPNDALDHSTIGICGPLDYLLSGSRVLFDAHSDLNSSPGHRSRPLRVFRHRRSLA